MTTSVQRSHYFGFFSSANNDTATHQLIIVDIRIFQQFICEFCGIIGHEADGCILHGPNSLPPSIRRKIIQFNALRGDEPTDLPRDWNSQHPEVHFKSRTSPLKTSPVVLAIIGRLNRHAVDNGDVEVRPS